MDTNGDGSIDFEAAEKPRSSGIFWGLRGISLLKFQFLYRFIMIYTILTLFQTILNQYLHAPTRALKARTQDVHPKLATATGVHGHDAGRQCRGQDCDVRDVLVTMCCDAKHPRVKGLHFCNPSVPLQSGSSNSLLAFFFFGFTRRY